VTQRRALCFAGVALYGEGVRSVVWSLSRVHCLPKFKPSRKIKIKIAAVNGNYYYDWRELVMGGRGGNANQGRAFTKGVALPLVNWQKEAWKPQRFNDPSLPGTSFATFSNQKLGCA
jgi:hypothetical protein